MRHLAAVLLLGSAAILPAQVTPVAGTGCGMSTTVVQFAPTIGQQIVVTNPFVCFAQAAVVVLGTPSLFAWTNCSNLSCPIGVAPIVLAANSGYVTLTLQIPNNPGLIGFCFRAQTGCASGSCLSTDRAVDICVQ
jgi:hypothetical protein